MVGVVRPLLSIMMLPLPPATVRLVNALSVMLKEVKLFTVAEVIVPALSRPPFTSEIVTEFAFTPATDAEAVAFASLLIVTAVVDAVPSTVTRLLVLVVLTALLWVEVMLTVVPPLTLIAPFVVLPALELVMLTATAPVGAVLLPTVMVPPELPVVVTDTSVPPLTVTAAAA